jgi:uncharacterized membrane protein YcaP (DUF421 family)
MYIKPKKKTPEQWSAFSSGWKVFIFLWLLYCDFGKKELSQLNTADVILILLISNLSKWNASDQH